VGITPGRVLPIFQQSCPSNERGFWISDFLIQDPDTSSEEKADRVTRKLVGRFEAAAGIFLTKNTRKARSEKEDTMIVIERMVQQIRQDKWAELEAIDKKYNVVEARLGFPAKKRMRSLSGSYDMSTLVIERQWSSMAAMEAAYEKTMTDPEYQALGMESNPIIKNIHWELYMPMP
jgi:hypothetical protein